MSTRRMVFGALMGLVSAAVSVFLYGELIGASSSMTATMLTTRKERTLKWTFVCAINCGQHPHKASPLHAHNIEPQTAHDATRADHDYSCNTLSVALAEMQQNITTTVLHATASASVDEGASSAGRGTVNAPSFLQAMGEADEQIHGRCMAYWFHMLILIL